MLTHIHTHTYTHKTQIPLNSLLTDPENNPKWTGWVPIHSTYNKPRGEVELAFELVPLAAPEKDASPDDEGVCVCVCVCVYV